MVAVDIVGASFQDANVKMRPEKEGGGGGVNGSSILLCFVCHSGDGAACTGAFARVLSCCSFTSCLLFYSIFYCKNNGCEYRNTSYLFFAAVFFFFLLAQQHTGGFLNSRSLIYLTVNYRGIYRKPRVRDTSTKACTHTCAGEGVGEYGSSITNQHSNPSECGEGGKGGREVEATDGRACGAKREHARLCYNCRSIFRVLNIPPPPLHFCFP